jgi:four helix bundle protein
MNSDRFKYKEITDIILRSFYKITSKFPKEERYGLVSQMRRSSISVPSNIAEGYGRKTTADYIRFLYIAYGSNCELETQMRYQAI